MSEKNLISDKSEKRSSLSTTLKDKFSFFNKSKQTDDEPTGHTASISHIDDDPPLTPLKLEGYSSGTKNRLLDPEIGEDIRNILPARMQIEHRWQLLYSLEQHGASLSTLYHNSKPQSQYDRYGYVLLIKDEKNGIFGSYTNEYFHTTDSRRYFGNGECFLWKTKYLQNGDSGRLLQFKAFPYTGINDFVMYCTSEFLSLGGGDGHYGLWVDHDLLNGVSDQSMTFGNEPLSEQGTKFGILGVEVWRVG